MEPWSYELAGRFDEHDFESEVLRGNPLGDPHVRPLWVYLPPGIRRGRARPPLPVDLRDPGADRASSTCGATGPRSAATTPELVDELFAEGRVAAGDRRLGRRVDVARRQPVHRLARDRPLPHLPRATRSCRSSTRATGRCAEAAHRGIAGKSSGGYGAMVDADAAAGRVRRARDARRRRPVRDVLPAGLPRGRCGRCGTSTTARSTASGTTSAHARRSRSSPTRRSSTTGAWPRATRRTRTARCSCRTTPTTGELRPDVWERWLAWDPVRMARQRGDALRSLRAIYIDCRQARRVLPRPRRGGVPAGARGQIGVTDSSSSSSTRRTRRSSTATRSA